MDEEQFAALRFGQQTAIVVVVGLLIDRGLIDPAEIIQRLDAAANRALQRPNGALIAHPIEQLKAFVAHHHGYPTQPS